MSVIQGHRIVDNPVGTTGQPVPTSSDLQEVTTNGNTTDVGIYYPNVGANLGGNSGNTFTLDIGADFTIVSSAQGFALDFTTGVLNTVITQNATQQRTIELPDADGTLLLDISPKHTIVNADYGTVNNLTVNNTSLYFEGAGTGISTVNIDNTLFPIGGIVIISDLDAKAAANNITIDVGVGNTINLQGNIGQTASLTIDGASYTIEKATTTKWMVI